MLYNASIIPLLGCPEGHTPQGPHSEYRNDWNTDTNGTEIREFDILNSGRIALFASQ